MFVIMHFISFWEIFQKQNIQHFLVVLLLANKRVIVCQFQSKSVISTQQIVYTQTHIHTHIESAVLRLKSDEIAQRKSTKQQTRVYND